MGVRILSVDGDGQTCLFDSTTGWAFGPLFEDDLQAERFLEWSKAQGHEDVRRISDAQFRVLVEMFFSIEVEFKELHSDA